MISNIIKVKTKLFQNYLNKNAVIKMFYREKMFVKWNIFLKNQPFSQIDIHRMQTIHFYFLRDEGTVNGYILINIF